MWRFNDFTVLVRELRSSTSLPKKKTLDQIKEILNGEEIIDALNQSSVSNADDKLNWDNLFVAVHNSLLEIEEHRRRKETSTTANLSLQCSSILIFIVKKACLKNSWIKCSTLIHNFLTVMSANNLKQNIGFIYIDILKFILVSQRKYRSNITHEQWKGLFCSIVELYKLPPARVEHSLVVEILNIIVWQGSCQSDLSKQTRDLFPLLKTTFQGNHFCKYKILHQERLIQLSVTLCSQAAQECRTALCRFGEEVICPLICMFDKFSTKGKCLLHDLLLLQVHAHHPGGSPRGSLCSYAYDWKQWNVCLDSMYNLVLAEIDHPFDKKCKHVSSAFLHLAVEVCRQVFIKETHGLETDDSEDLAGPSPKRRRKDVGIMSFAQSSQTSDDSQTNSWLSVCLIGNFVAKYPDKLTKEEFVSLLEMVAEVQSTCKNDLLMKHTCLCCISLLKAEKHSKNLEESIVNSLWEKIWDTMIRTVGLNQNEEESHNLLQAMILHDKAKHLSVLCNMYTNNTFRISLSSVQTLNVLLSKYDMSSLAHSGEFSSSHKAIRNKFLEWMLPEQNSEMNITVSSSVVADVLLQLSSKTVMCSRCHNNLSNNCTTLSIMLQKMDKCYITSSFECVVSNNETNNLSTTAQGICVDVANWESIQKLLNHKCRLVCVQQSSCQFNITNLKNAFYHLSLLIDVWAVFSSVLPGAPLFVKTMDSLMKYVSNQIVYQLDIAEGGSSHIIEIFRKFQTLLSTRHPEQISQWLCDSISIELVNSVCCFVTSRKSSSLIENDILERDELSYGKNENEEFFSSSLDECFNIECCHFPQIISEDLTEDQKLHLECLKFLGCYCTLGNGQFGKVTNLAKELLPSVPLIDLQSFNGVVWIIQCILDNDTVDTTVLSAILVRLKKLFTTWSYDSETTLIVLQLFKATVPHVHKNESDSLHIRTNFLSLIKGFFQCIARNRFGVKVSVSFMRCLEAVSQVDPSASWSKIGEDNAGEIILNFLDSSSHEIRLTAVDCLKSVLQQSAGCMDESWHLKMFSDICEKISQSFIVEGEVSQYCIDDEIANRSSSALHTYVAVLLSSPVLYKQSLFQLLKFCKEKNLDVDLFKRGISYFCSIIKIDLFAFISRNLPFLVRQWLENSYPLQDLAKYLYQWPLATFYIHCKNVLIPELLLRSDETTMKDVETLSKLNMMELFEGCFSQIMGELLPGLQSENVSAFHCQNQLQNVISKDGVETLLASNLPNVIVAVFKKIHDPAHFINLIGINAPLPSPETGSISYDTAVNCMTYLQRCSPSPKRDLFEFLCETSPKYIQMILLDLTVDIYEAVLLPDKLDSFHHYAVFVEVLTLDLRKNSTLAVIPHIICCIVHNLIHLIRNAQDTELPLSTAACNFLKHFCELCLPRNSDILSKLLVLITDTLVPAVKTGGDLGSAAMNLLKFLFVEKCEHFSDTFLLIDPLPNDSLFYEIQNTIGHLKKQKIAPNLEQEIKSFLKMRYMYGKQCVESLKNLHQQLSHQKEELKGMFNNLLSSRGFSEDCKTSLLHRLIYTLVQLATSSEFEVSIQAGYCLGEIGPADLGTLVLRPDAELPVIDVSDIVPLIAECLLDSNIPIGKAASLAMYSILKYKESNKLKEKQYVMSCGISCADFLHPFNVRKKFQTLTFGINDLSGVHIGDKSMWCPMEDMLHDQWVIQLTVATLRCLSKGNNFLQNIIPLCKGKASFAEHILPLFVSKLMNLSSECSKKIAECIEDFFENHVKLQCSTVSSGRICLNKASVRCMLNLVHFLRVHEKLESDNVEWNPLKLNLNYLNIAQAAQFCNAHFSSILYVELWSDMCLRTESSEEVYGQPQTLLERICEKNPENGCVVQKILWEAYLKICDTDAIYGCGSSLYLDPSKRPLHYELRGQWDKVILSHDVQLSSGCNEAARGLVYALQKAGFQHVLDVYLKSVSNTTFSEDLQYECAWRLANWDSQVVNLHTRQSNFEQYHFLALRALSSQDKIGLNEALNLAHKCVSESLINICLESCKSIYKPLSQFQQIQEMNEFQLRENELPFEDIVKKWMLRDEISFNQFEDIEPVLWQRIVMLNSSHDDELKEKAAVVAAKLAGLAREEGRLQVAAKCLSSFNIYQLPSSVHGLLKMEEARLAWNSGDHPLGKSIMRDLLNTLHRQDQSMQNPAMYAQALKLYGDWMVESKSENSQVVIDKYYLKALNILKNVGSSVSENMLDIYSALAHFADQEYQNLSNYVKSRAYEVKKEWIEKAAQDIANLKKQTNRTKDDDRTIIMKMKQSKIDNEEISNIGKQKNKYLADAVKYYLQCLEHGDRNNLDIFRVASLWLENMLHPSLKVILDNHLFKVPSYKFIPILPQLAPRMSNVKDDFTLKLSKLLVRCAEDHPHHTLPIILALSNSYKDQDFNKGVPSSQSRKQEPRVLGAQKLVQDLSKHDLVGDLLQKMNYLYVALIRMAYVEEVRTKGSDRVIPENEPLCSLQMMETVLVPTLSIAVDKSCKYNIITGVVKYEPTYSLVGGINAPKKLTCLGTDGIKRIQLVKGQDDLRQDAVMQQVFTIMNTFLRKSKDTSKRKLLIRTYKVLPLSQRSGIIEWCENTVPLLIYLTGNDHRTGAHKKYFPNDEMSLKCREKMKSVSTKSLEQKLSTYKEICCSFHPVLRYFFLEHFTSPGMWFERRLAYIHSVATSSMIGYILGLGDRHLMNILIDKITAEVIHIDFGIAFEMGHILPTPETVPFRLTRDIVDGMGVSGVEGIFQRSCEKTMYVLREHQTIILTVLEVLLYDPLYAWTITPSKAYLIQRKDVKLLDESDSVQVNRMAERALQRLKQKLLGTEVGAGVPVPTQVSRLIQEASDPGNLCRLYFGWEPFL